MRLLVAFSLLLPLCLAAACSEPTAAGPATTIDRGELTLRHQTNFLTEAGYTHLYAARSWPRRAWIAHRLRRAEYTHLYLYVMNENDYGGPAFNYYDSPREFRAVLEEVHSKGLLPVVWLAPDDAPTLHRELPPAELMRIWDTFIPEVDDLVSSYVLGLEMDEYWRAREYEQLGAHLGALTERPIFVHMRPGLWEPALSPWCRGVVYQYGFGKSADEIESVTRDLVPRLHAEGKIFIAGEYSVREPAAHAVALGDVALNAGADGFGNGGTRRWTAAVRDSQGE
jgi:hypothetical protein